MTGRFSEMKLGLIYHKKQIFSENKNKNTPKSNINMKDLIQHCRLSMHYNSKKPVLYCRRRKVPNLWHFPANAVKKSCL
jgi:hypothetical protein